MPTPYIELTNRLLRRLNEVPLSQSDFPAARGVQAMAKDAINAAIAGVNQRYVEWPFNAKTHKAPLVAGTQEYAFPHDLRLVKWKTFMVCRDSINPEATRLKLVTRDYWEDYYKDRDVNAVPNGIEKPVLVFEGHGYGFAVSPLPDKPYNVSYEYFMLSPALSLHSDVPAIPSAYDEVIIQGGLYHFYMFRDNNTQAQAAEKRFNQLLEEMYDTLIGRETDLRGSMIVRGVRQGSIF